MRKEKFIKRFFASKLFLFFGLIILGLLFFVFGKKMMESRQIDKELKAMEENIHRLESQNVELNKFLSYLNTDEFVEQEARLKFNLQKPGESVVILPESNLESKDKNIQSSDKGMAVVISNPKKWWNYFFKR